MRLVEIQVDRVVGPTHHFGGLGVGNVASASHAGDASNPAAAALQGLDKMRLVAGLGVPQFVLPPHPRPNVPLFNSVGFDGQLAEVLQASFERSPEMLSAAMSCSAMWTANAATVCPAIDSRQSELTLTVANLVSSLHRAGEPVETEADLQRLFTGVARIRGPLAGGSPMRDEGAANHMRLGTVENQRGVHLFVYGDSQPAPKQHWPRQTLAASRAVARTLGLDGQPQFFLKQSAQAIDAGAFHNDVVAASHQNLLIHHESAFESSTVDWNQIEECYQEVCGKELIRLEVSAGQLSLDDAIATYLFNSQIVSPAGPDQSPVMICPAQVQETRAAKQLVEDWCQQGHFSEVHYLDLRQSMSGGGGPACLRLRVPMTEDQIERLPASQRWSPSLDRDLRDLIGREYPTRITLKDLADERLIDQTIRAETRVTDRLLNR